MEWRFVGWYKKVADPWNGENQPCKNFFFSLSLVPYLTSIPKMLKKYKKFQYSSSMVGLQIPNEMKTTLKMSILFKTSISQILVDFVENWRLSKWT